MTVEYHPDAANDLNEAISYYNQQHTGLGDALRADVYGAIDRIAADPLRYPIIEHDVRRGFVRRFPYSVLFRLVGGDVIRILVIRHHRRHQDYGLVRR